MTSPRPIPALFLGGLLLSSGSAPAAQPNSPAGVANFRDVGGYSTKDGHKIKMAALYRSGELSGVTPEDQQFFAKLNLKYEIDLRTNSERAANPTKLSGEPLQVVAISVGQPAEGSPMDRAAIAQMSKLKSAEDAKHFMAAATARIALDGAPDIGRVLQHLASGEEPALLHCTAGKDRTGVTVAVFMTILGASREDVYHEYLRSNEAVQAQLDRQKARSQAGADSVGLGGIDPAALRVLMGTDARNLDAVFQAIDAKYGSFDGYVRDGLRLTAEQIAGLRRNLLEP